MRKTSLRRTGFKKKLILKRQTIKPRATKRAKEENEYLRESRVFINDHPVCPVSGGRTNQLHHSAGREGGWLNLKRYWIAMSQEGHKWVEEHKTEAEKVGLIVRIYETYAEHISKLVNHETPIFYENHPSLPLDELAYLRES